jgi:hypothetical protein
MLNTKAVRLAELLGKEPLDADELHVQLGNMLVAYNAEVRVHIFQEQLLMS